MRDNNSGLLCMHSDEHPREINITYCVKNEQKVIVILFSALFKICTLFYFTFFSPVLTPGQLGQLTW